MRDRWSSRRSPHRFSRSWPPVHAGAPRGHRAVVRGPSDARSGGIPGSRPRPPRDAPSVARSPSGALIATATVSAMPQLIHVGPTTTCAVSCTSPDLAAAVIHDAVASDGRSAANGGPASTPFESVAARPLLTARAVTKHFEDAAVDRSSESEGSHRNRSRPSTASISTCNVVRSSDWSVNRARERPRWR